MSIRDNFIREKEKQEAKKQNAIQKADQKLVKAVSKKEGVVSKKIA